MQIERIVESAKADGLIYKPGAGHHQKRRYEGQQGTGYHGKCGERRRTGEGELANAQEPAKRTRQNSGASRGSIGANQCDAAANSRKRHFHLSDEALALCDEDKSSHLNSEI